MLVILLYFVCNFPKVFKNFVIPIPVNKCLPGAAKQTSLLICHLDALLILS